MGQLVSDVADVLKYQENKKQASATKKEILEKIAANEAQKTNLVKKVLASQRAKYGAGGMSKNGQTEEKVLARLQKETEEPFETSKKENLAKLKNTSAKKKNILNSVLKHFDKLIG